MFSSDLRKRLIEVSRDFAPEAVSEKSSIECERVSWRLWWMVCLPHVQDILTSWGPFLLCKLRFPFTHQQGDTPNQFSLLGIHAIPTKTKCYKQRLQKCRPLHVGESCSVCRSAAAYFTCSVVLGVHPCCIPARFPYFFKAEWCSSVSIPHFGAIHRQWTFGLFPRLGCCDKRYLK